MTATEDAGSRILDAASELFAERGYASTTTRAIAERAGVNEVTLFRKFQNKRGILEALGARWAEHMAGLAVPRLPAEDDTRGTLETLADMEVRQASEAGPAAMRLVLDARVSPEIAEVMGSGPNENFAGVAEYLKARQAAGDLRRDIDPHVMAEAFFALTSQIVMSRQVLRGSSEVPYGISFDEANRQLLELFLAGVGLESPRPKTSTKSAEKAPQKRASKEGTS